MGNHHIDCKYCGQDQRLNDHCCDQAIEEERVKASQLKTRQDAALDILTKRGISANHTMWGVHIYDWEKVAELLGSTWEDRDTPYEAEIDAAHPLKSRDWKRYQKAVELVGAKHSKYALVDLVNWLLSRGPDL